MVALLFGMKFQIRRPPLIYTFWSLTAYLVIPLAFIAAIEGVRRRLGVIGGLVAVAGLAAGSFSSSIRADLKTSPELVVATTTLVILIVWFSVGIKASKGWGLWVGDWR